MDDSLKAIRDRETLSLLLRKMQNQKEHSLRLRDNNEI